MLVSELADRADVPLATVKYYLREGLLAARRDDRTAPRGVRRGAPAPAARPAGAARGRRRPGVGAPGDRRRRRGRLATRRTRCCARSPTRSAPRCRRTAPDPAAAPERGRGHRRRGLERRPAGRRRTPASGRRWSSWSARSCSRVDPEILGVLRPPRRPAVPDRVAPHRPRPRTARARWRTWSSERRSSGRSSPCSAGWGTSTTTSSDAATRR